MASLKSRLRDLARREGTFADVKSECIRLASGDEQSYAQIRRILKNALDDGTLSAERHAGLERAMEAVVLADGGSLSDIPDAAERTDIGAVRPAATTLDDDEPTVSGALWHTQAETTLADDEPTIISGLPRPEAVGGAETSLLGEDEDTVLRPWANDDGSEQSLHKDFVGEERDDESTTIRPSPVELETSLGEDDDTRRPRDHSGSKDAYGDEDDAPTVRGAATSSAGTPSPGTAGTAPPETTLADDEQTIMRPAATLVDGEQTIMRPFVSLQDDEQTVIQPSTSLRDDETTLQSGTPAPDDPDATMVTSEATLGEDDKTVKVAGLSEDPDATVIVPDDGDRTMVADAEDGDVTTLNPGGGDERTRILDGGHTSTDSGDDTWDPTAPAMRAAIVERVFSKGSVLKERFRLTDPLGEGGMGTVWKAVDTLKLEAQDRNPYVAIKLLQGDFKEHPEAFIALQRESSKQQRLAHPNIATVFDFDREASSNTVFMTMEVMDGSDLADFIKTLPDGGLPYEEAMDLIEQLGAGLDYAHKAGLVHSDLKPGNCFLTNDRRVKLLDFGIARASATREDAEGEETKFDPGQLGALTPSYATLEMFQGMEPDPRDDIYAMAIIAHQLLTGKHPYNRRSAPKALKDGLKVDPLDKLNTRQNRTLARGLEFERENRIGSVEEFLDGLRVKKRNKALIALPIALAATLMAGLYAPVTNYLEEQDREAIISEVVPADVAAIENVLNLAGALDDIEQTQLVLADERVTNAVLALLERGDEKAIQQGLALIAKFPSDIGTAIKDDRRAQDAVFALYEGRRDAAFAPLQSRYDIDAARVAVARLAAIYPNLRRVVTAQDQLDERVADALATQSARLHEALAAGALLPDPDALDVGEVLVLVKQFAPDADMLRDPAIAEAYRDAANRAIAKQSYGEAERVLSAGLEHAPESAELVSLNNDVLAELKRIRNAEVAATLERTLSPVAPGLVRLPDFEPVRDDLLRLAEVKPESELLIAVRAKLDAAFAEYQDTLVSQSDWEGAQRSLVDYARFLDLEFVLANKARLARLAGAAGATMPYASADVAAATSLQLTALLGAPEATSAWEQSVVASFKQLVAMSAPGDARVTEQRVEVARASAAQARALVARDQYDAAERAIARVRVIHPTWEQLAAENDFVSKSRAEYERIQAEQARLARIAELKQEIESQAMANEPSAALVALNALREELPEDDEFVSREGARAVAESFARKAAVVAGESQPELAIALVREGLSLAPDLQQLLDIQRRLLGQLEQRAVDAQVISPPAVSVASASPASPGAEMGPVTSLPATPTLARGVSSSVTTVQAAPTLEMSAVAEPRSQSRLYPPASVVDDTQLAATAQKKLLSSFDFSPANFGETVGLLGTFSALFPRQADAFKSAVATASAERIAAALRDDSQDPSELFQPVRRYGELFPDADGVMRQRAAEAFRSRLSVAAKAGRQIANLGGDIRAFREMLPGHANAMSLALSPVLSQSIVANAKRMPDAIASLRSDVEAFRELLPEARKALDTQLGAVLIERIVANTRDDTTLERLLLELAAFTQLIPEANDTLRQRVARAALDSLLASTQSDSTLTALEEPLARYRRAFPDNDVTRLADAAITSVVKPLDSGEATAFAITRAGQSRFIQMFPDKEPDLQRAISRRVGDVLRERAAQVTNDLSTLAEPTRAAREILGAASNDVLRGVAASVAAVLGKSLAGGVDMQALAAPVAQYRDLFAEHESALVDAVARPAANALAEQSAAKPRALGDADASIQSFRALFPQQSELLDERLLSRVVDSLRVSATKEADSPGAYVDSVAAFVRWLPTSGSALESAVAPVFEDGIERSTRTSPNDLQALEKRLSAFRQMFPARAQRLSERSSVIVIGALQNKYQGDAMSLPALRDDVANFAQVFPRQTETLRARLAPTVSESVLASVAKTPDDMVAASDAARAYAEVFPRASDVTPNVTQVLWNNIESIAREAAGDTSRLVSPLGDFGRLFPTEFSRRSASLAERLANDIERLTREKPRDLDNTKKRLDGFTALFPDRAQTLRVRLAAPVIAAYSDSYRAKAPNLEAVSSDQSAFGAVFPTQLDRFRDRVSGVVAEQLLAGIAASPNDIAGARAASDAYAAVFPQQANFVRSDVAQSLWGQIAAEAESRPGDLLAIADTLYAFRASFAEAYDSLSVSLATRIGRTLQSQARDPDSQLDMVAKRLEQFRVLFPVQHGKVASDVGVAIAERLQQAKVETVQQVARLGPALRELEGLFPDRHELLSDALSQRLVERVQSLVKQRPFLASELRKTGLDVFPGNTALAALRIELPLAEVNDGLQLLAAGKLTAAAAKLSEAVKADPQHSTIPGFRTELEKKQQQAEAAYTKYVRVVKTSRKPGARQKAFRVVRTLWSDNKKFTQIEPPAPNACTTTKTGLGQRHLCYDMIGRSRRARGPVMVVVPAGGGVSEPFAISKYEISVHDYGAYCRASKQCQAPRGKRTLPMHNVSLKQIEAYAAWLSEKGNTSYRLPTAAEWEHAANADGAQPKRDFNCTVTVGKQQLKGLSLTSVKSGNQNGWGLINYIGNVRELVRDGDTLSARGGSYKNKLNNCRISLSVNHNGAADPVTGFRLVREVTR